MNKRMVRMAKRLGLWLSAGVLLSTVTCVRDLADVVGTGLSVGSLTGEFGDGTQAVSSLGAGFDVVADLMRFARFIN